MVQSINDQGDETRRVDVFIPFSREQFRRAVDQVRAKYGIDDAVLVCLVESVKTVSEKSERRRAEDLARVAGFERPCDLEHRFA